MASSSFAPALSKFGDVLVGDDEASSAPPADEESLLLIDNNMKKGIHRRQQLNFQQQSRSPLSWMSAIVFVTSAIVLSLMYGYRANFHLQRTPQGNHQQQHLLSSKLKTLENKPQITTPQMNDGSTYTGTQFISYTINTFGGLAEHGECVGREIDYLGGDGPTCYLGNRQNITEDFEHRLDLLIEVLDDLKKDIQTKSEASQIDHRTHVLKIFVLPEFYLRGPEGAYSMEELMDDGILFQAAHRLSHYIKTPEFSDYLFVFGTVIAASRAEINNNNVTRPWDAPKLDDNQVLYYNFSPVFRGGAEGTKAAQERYIIPKKTVSRIDFLNNMTRLPNPYIHGKQYDSIPKNFKRFLESRGIKLLNNNIIDVDGIRIGIEICLDHKMGLLWDTLRQTDGDLVDVHLITSAGMQIEYGPNPIVPGGVTYLSDGVGTSAACWRHSEDAEPFDPDQTCRVPTPTAIKHYPPVPNRGYSDFFTMSACQDVLDFEMMKGYYTLYQTEGCAKSLSDFGLDVVDELRQALPSIEFYPTVDLPVHK